MGIYKKIFTLLVLLLSSVMAVSAASQVLDVSVTENVYEQVLYNPLKSGSGLWFDANENQTVYQIKGTIVIKNVHATEAVESSVINFSSADDIYNVTHSLGREGSVLAVGTVLSLSVPDLGPGQNATFTYNVNGTNVQPILNFTTSYSDSKIFTGNSFTVSDVIQNIAPTCIYNINVTHRAYTLNIAGTNYYFNLSAPLTGADSGNAAVIGTQRINWNVLNRACLNSGLDTDLGYTVLSPAGLSGGYYKFSNSTISYRFNSTISQMTLASIEASADLDLKFNKFLVTYLNGDNATWKVNGSILSTSPITVNVTSSTFWVSVRDATGTGFTSPATTDVDSVSGASLLRQFNPNVLMNSTLPQWQSANWLFNYTFSSSPIVWMNANNKIVNDGVQLLNRSVTYGKNQLYIREIYVASGYWLEISKNITRLGNNSYNVLVKLVNLGSSPTPTNQIVQVYNFLPIFYTLTSPMVFSVSPWYTTASANETLTDVVYNGTMFQFGLLPASNPFNSSLAGNMGTLNGNNTWSLRYNITGSGNFNFEDLFLTGVDPLHVDEVGSVKSLYVAGQYGGISAKVEYLLIGVAAILGAAFLLI